MFLYPESGLYVFRKVITLMVHPNPDMRPTSSELLESLKGVLRMAARYVNYVLWSAVHVALWRWSHFAQQWRAWEILTPRSSKAR